MLRICLIFSFALCSGVSTCLGASIAGQDAVEQPLPIVKSLSEQKSDGSYFFAYESADGSYREEVGILKQAGTAQEELEISGTYRYTDANGEKVEVSYVADKNGFRPLGSNIPKQISEAARTAGEGGLLSLLE